MKDQLKKSSIFTSDYFVLFIDDEDKAAKYFHRLFSQHFKIIVTTSPIEALDIIEKKRGEIAVVVSDQRMPERTGVNLLQEIKDRDKNIIRILTTAYADLNSNIDAINKSQVFAYITKPWDTDNVISILGRAIGEFESRKNYLALSASIAHEMRNPLNSVRQSTTIAKERLEKAHLGETTCPTSFEKMIPISSKDFHEIVSSTDIALSSATRGNIIIDAIMDSIREKPVDVRSFKNFRISEIVNLVMREYAFEPNQKERIIIDIKPDQDFSVKCNETLLSYAFFNLLKNSLYYADSHPNLTITISSGIGYDKFDHIYFRDNGPGVPKARLGAIFEAFSTSGKPSGTGLGLAFCKRTMKNFSGTITCDSNEGEYTEFVLSFPKSIQRKRSFETSNCVLLVDDQQTVLLITKRILEKGLESTSCTMLESGIEAVERLKYYHYDLIVMDIEMLGMTGIETVRKIREFDKETPIMAYSLRDIETMREELESAGFDDYLHKLRPVKNLLRMSSKLSRIKLTRSLLSDEEINAALDKKRILFADDDSVNLFLTKHQLEKYRTEVDIAKNGLEAVDLAKWEDYDLILMDISMPKMDGITAAKKIREFQAKNNKTKIPIIAFTGDDSKNKIREILEAGFDDYFIKGRDHKELVEIMALKSEGNY